MPARWLLPADPCAVCVAFAYSLARAFTVPHSCALTLTRAATLTDPEAEPVPVAFARAIRDA
jgi:hypothetical protein